MSDRVAPLAGVHNFRDFGGYETRDGGMIARGHFYRSAHFANATPEDITLLNALGVAFVVDLRRPEERAVDPNKWPGERAVTIFNDEGMVRPPAHVGVYQIADHTPELVAQFMRENYAGYPYELRYAALFKAFLNGLLNDGPGVVHCAAGKDRTGIACALVLTALGVDRELIFEDYELTNTAVDLQQRMAWLKTRIAMTTDSPPSDAALLPMVGVQRDYLQASFDAIEARDGDVLSYLANALEFGPEQVQALQRRAILR
jgi:protein-tyrosine phosphatase